MTSHADWKWQMTEHDTRDRQPSTLAAMNAIEAAYKKARNGWRPSVISAALPEGAKPLTTILKASKVAAVEMEQLANTRLANRQRARFNWWLFFAVIASGGAAIISGLMLIQGLSWNSQPDGSVLAAAQLGLLASASLFWFLLWAMRPYRHWLLARGRAESLRQKLFELVLTEADAASPPEPSTGATENDPTIRQLALEYFRVGLLDDQIAWYQNKAASARREGFLIGAARIAGFMILVAAMAMSGIAGIAQFVAGAHELFAWLPPWASNADLTALLTIVGTTALTSAQAADSALLSARNRARYREMAMALRGLRSERLAAAQTAARNAAPETGADDAQLFAMRVREMMAIEHAEWKAVLEQSTQRLTEHVPPLRE